ncbi:MAG TPA: hypothetical protein VK563_00365 [Puia sp.]|nr:hypothetical protein [Puia sp.]
MNVKNFFKPVLPAVVMLLLLPASRLQAQTDEDAIMMPKNNLCLGGMYSYNSWKNYWEGTFKRNNQNIGTVSTQMFSLMGTYGISSKLNVIVGAPYVSTHASAGTLHGMHGVQDLSLWVKWLAVEQNIGSGTLSLYAVGGGSLPLTNYIADFLPLSIGLHSRTLSGRIIADYQTGNFFATASGTYTLRDNIKIDRTSYYTTSEHLTNEVEMPDMGALNFRAGYRGERGVAEVVYSRMYTLGGFDIRKNDMPFPSNKMNASMLGVHFKYNFKAVNGLSLIGGGDYTLTGRNVGQATAFDGGVFYILDFSHKAKKAKKTSKQEGKK